MIDSKLRNIFSKFIRLRDSDSDGFCCCITCGKRIKWDNGQMHAGHFMSSNNKSTQFNEKNVNGQCSECNTYKSGRQFEHGVMIDKKYGAGTAFRLMCESKQICKRGKFEIDTLTEYYKKEVARLKKEKNL